MITHGSLFTGIGGADLGAERVGIHTSWQVEKNLFCRRVLEHRWHDVKRYPDVRSVPPLPYVDVISFGSPCHGLSIAGHRDGLEDSDSKLFFKAIEIIDQVKPEFVIWENVLGALSSNAGKDFGAVLDGLAQIGAMDIAWRVLDARFFGCPQQRRRLFVIADFRGQRASKILHERSQDRKKSNALVSPTLTPKGRIVVGSRWLMPVEWERLQGFPDGWTCLWSHDQPCSCADGRRYQMLGNAINVNVAEWLFRRMYPHGSKIYRKPRKNYYVLKITSSK